MNSPGREGGWWGWRYTREMFSARAAGIAMGLAELARLYGRMREDALAPSAPEAVEPEVVEHEAAVAGE